MLSLVLGMCCVMMVVVTVMMVMNVAVRVLMFATGVLTAVCFV